MRMTRFYMMALMLVFMVAGSGAHASALSENAASSPEGPRLLVDAADGGKMEAGAQSFVDNMGQKAISFLGNEEYSQEQKEAEFRRLLRNSFDMKTIGRFALGRYWSVATPAQQKEYLKLFEDMVVDVYAARFNEYKGQSLDVSGVRADGDKDALVTSYIVAPGGGQKIQVDWRVRGKGGNYKIVDVIIEGVSMALTQRSDYSSVIQRGGGDVVALLEHLRAKQQ